MRPSLSEFLAVAAGAVGSRKVVRRGSVAGQVELAVADGTKKKALGFTTYAVAASAEVVVQLDGYLDGFVGLTPGAVYYLSQTAPGEIVDARPARGETQVVGVARSATEMDVGLQMEIVGEGYQYVEAGDRSTTTDPNYQDKVTIVTPSLTGIYRIGWCAIVDNEGFLGDVRLRNTTDGANVGDRQSFKAADADERMAVGGFAHITFAGQAKTFKLQWRDRAGGNTQGIRDARVELWRVN